MKPKLSFFIGWLIVIFLLSGGYLYGQKDNGAAVRAKIFKAKDEILSYFRPVSGIVDDIKDGKVKVKIENNTIMPKGMRLAVFRKGEPFYHPVTNELIGNAEDYAGQIEIIEGADRDGSYLCSVIKGDIKSGDVVRISQSKIKLAFFQDRKSDWQISEEFFDSLKDSERFEILEKYAPSYEPETLSRLAEELGAEIVLLFSTPVVDRARSLNVKLYWPHDSRKFREIVEVLGHIESAMLKTEDEFVFDSLIDREPWGSFKIEGGRLCAIGDVDSNGNQEIVISDGNNIRIYNLKDELQESWIIKGKPDEIHLSLDILDLNNNGIAEIFVTSLIEGDYIDSDVSDDALISRGNKTAISSYVIEYDPVEGYKKIIKDEPYFFRVMGGSLFMQRYRSGRTFWGPLFKGKWMNGKYLPATTLNLPAGVNIYGFTFIDWQNKGSTHIVSYDDKGYLNLFDNSGNYIWKSEKTYGKFPLEFEEQTGSVSNPSYKWSVRGRLIALKTERGHEVLVVNKVPIVSKVPGLGTKNAEVYSLWWDGATMEEKLVLDDIPGYITDYMIDARKLYLIAKGNVMSFVKKIASGELVKGGTLYYYNFGEK